MNKVSVKRCFNSALSGILLLCILSSTLIGMFSASAEEENAPDEILSFNAYQSVKAQQLLGDDQSHQYSDKYWIYEEQATDGTWSSPVDFRTYHNDWAFDGIIDTEMPNSYCFWSGAENRWLAMGTKNDKVVMSSRTNNSHTASVLTFVAPQTGTVKLYDPNGGKIGAASKEAPFYTLNNNDEEIGLTIYKNNEKIWPESDDYYILTPDETEIDFPEINGIRVTKGDRLRIAFKAINNDWGFVALSPQVDYVGEITSYDYDAYEAVKKQQEAGTPGDWRSYNDKNWVYEEQSADGSWNSPNLQKGDNMWGIEDYIQSALPDMYYYWNAAAGRYLLFSTNSSRVVMHCITGSAVTPALTFIVPDTGTVKLYDPNGGNMGVASQYEPFWTLNNENEKIGVAIYKNDEKIWPSDTEEGTEDGLYILSPEKTEVAFPEIDGIKVIKGDRLRIAFKPVNNDFGFVALAPHAEFTLPDENLPSYSAAECIEEMQEAGAVPSDAAWIYTPKRIVKNSENGMFEMTGDWLSPELAPGLSDNVGVNAVIPKQLNIPGIQNGIASAGGKVYTFVGNGTGYAPTVTFSAPFSGKITITDPSGIGIGSAGTGDPFWTLHEPKKVGVAIYKNDEKLWPQDGEYHVLNGNDWSTGSLVEGNLSVALPDFGTLEVTKGDKIRISMIPITLSWGYFILAPQVNYTEIDGNQPDITENKKYKADEEIAEAVKNGNFENSNWSAEGMPCFPNENGENLPNGKWLKLPLNPDRMQDNAINEAVPEWLKLSGTNLGIAAYNKGVLLSTGSSGVSYAIALTFTAPEAGTVNLSDPAGGMFGTADISHPFWTLNEASKVAGLAIYKNNEKIWPADKDYYKLQGQWDGSIGGYNYDNEFETLFPTLKNIELKKGDKLRMCVIPVQNEWHFIRLSPQVEYTHISDDQSGSDIKDDEKPKATYSAAGSIKNVIESKDASKSLWKFQAITHKDSDLAFPPLEFDALFAEKLPYIIKEMTFDVHNFGCESLNIPDSQLALGVDGTNRLLLKTRGSTLNGRVSPALLFEVPETGIIHLHSDDFNPGFSACSQYGPFYTLKSTWDPDEGDTIQLYVYKNNTQIWPKNGENNIVTAERRSIEFPDISFQVYKGDNVRIIVNSGIDWSFATMAPVVDYLSYNTKTRPAGDDPVWKYGANSYNDIVWDDLPVDSDDNSYSNDHTDYEFNGPEVEEPSEYGEENGKDPVKKTTKRIIRRKRVSGENNTVLIAVLIAAGVLLLSSGVTVFAVIRKKRIRRRESN